jgi:hypothetical protein
LSVCMIGLSSLLGLSVCMIGLSSLLNHTYRQC